MLLRFNSIIWAGVRNIAILSALLMLFASCGNLEEIEIGEPKDVSIKGFEDNYVIVNAKVPINNPSLYKIKLKEIDVRVFVNGNYMGKLAVDKSVVIKRKENKEYDLPVKIRLANPLGAAFTMMSMKKGQKLEVKFDGIVKAKTLFMTKEFPIEETTLIRL